MDNLKTYRHNCHLNEQSHQYLLEEKEKTQLSDGKIMDKIIAEYQSLKQEKASIAYVGQEINKTVQEAFGALFNSIRLGINSTDKNTRILVEIANGFLMKQSDQTIITTDDLISVGLEEATRKVQADIKRAQQMKLDKQKKERG
ncbi:hypothetical protein ACOC6V_002770 [Listeria monocytogenes]|uniref:Uncharacterized protein n=3 Tax=Listeria TaxID=1637 RepID=D7V1G6_LISGR|nr:MULTISPECIES: hypothetical protein [Listeria]EAG6272424.1 hypothetical protein [Listeria monocytogenes CFSAN003726]EAG6284957.1 hypothetical protein [Listeria monocytogenes CFSAN003810]EAG6360546.1 hypothetical protein [Listeria monocytogenes CFSAN003729]EAG6369496.1 hypothetical protein [Listeria monocytogenes CFSAN003728]ECR3486998.1 hypothetical protein [Listeria innocua]MCX62514.1 hypothetical protein [Listeria monocytogenes serotype 4b]MCX98343.1 hypothetical protein [Listeria monocy